MTENKNREIFRTQDEYTAGFADEDTSVFNTGRGISREVVETISRIKGEPEWVLEYRLKAFEAFEKMAVQDWGPDLSDLNFDDYIYYIRPADKKSSSWEDVPETIKNTFDRLGIPESEKKFLAGVTTQYESEAVYHNMLDEVQEKGVIFLDTDSAIRLYPDLVKEYLGKIVPYTDNKFAALNSAVFSGGSFIYVPPGVTLDKPLQSYFRINSEQMGQFERTIIIVDKGANLHYVEGCTAPIYKKDSLHAAVVEIYVHEDAKCRYSTVQNWSTNVLNLTTKRSKVMKNGLMEWVDGNIGSHVTMKYPACILAEEGAKGMTITIAVASKNQIQDTGAKMIHLAPNTSSSIISKSIARNGGYANFRDWIYIGPKADRSKTKIECDTLILDGISKTDTIPANTVQNDNCVLEHEATVSKISDEELFYLMSRGLNQQQATQMIIMGFLEPFTKELPVEYAVELNQLLKIDMEGAVG
ncbi:MAG: Fe-S cluster assembly protein SufB [Erysipelotrichaceae bacterium]|nr:Fe-S cluster assembly protein SufB [Erysipelotrichaceae bacterium]MBR2745907.1 Fe-S cluster assembly protein SufB [Erysipelotrichaceae bacterium]